MEREGRAWRSRTSRFTAARGANDAAAQHAELAATPADRDSSEKLSAYPSVWCLPDRQINWLTTQPTTASGTHALH